MPIRKVGSDTPIRETVISTCESHVWRCRPVYTPMGTPSASAKSADRTASSRVAGIRERIMSATGFLCWYEMPKSKAAAADTKRPNCSSTGSLRPRVSRSSSRSSRVVSMPTIWCTGSPTNWNIRNAISATKNITSSDCASRFTMNASIVVDPRLAGAGRRTRRQGGGQAWRSGWRGQPRPGPSMPARRGRRQRPRPSRRGLPGPRARGRALLPMPRADRRRTPPR